MYIYIEREGERTSKDTDGGYYKEVKSREKKRKGIR